MTAPHTTAIIIISLRPIRFLLSSVVVTCVGVGVGVDCVGVGVVTVESPSAIHITTQETVNPGCGYITCRCVCINSGENTSMIMLCGE